MLRVIKAYLRDEYDVATAVSGKVAFKFLERKGTDLILLDYEMPEMNGPDVLEKLREDKRFKDIPTIFLTGMTEREKVEMALSLKPQGYVLKPVEKDKLLRIIKQCIGK